MIELKDLTVKYGSITSLKDVNFTFKPGQVTCIIGENGSGKSTLLKSIMQMVPYTGNILYDEQNMELIKREDRARRIAYLPQVRPLPHIDVKTLVSHGRFPYLGLSRILTSNDKKIVDDAMEMLDLHRFQNVDVASLSGGERQRVYLAMAMVQCTDIIILDEPLTYMDIRHQSEIIKILHELNDAGKTIIYTSHDLPQAFSFSHEVMVLDRGEQIIGGIKNDVIKSGYIKDIFEVDLIPEDSSHSYYQYKLVQTDRNKRSG